MSVEIWPQDFLTGLGPQRRRQKQRLSDETRSPLFLTQSPQETT